MHRSDYSYPIIKLRCYNSETAVIVEGKKDKSALENLGVGSSCIIVLNKKPLFAVAEQLAANYKSAVILTDLDAEGKKLYGKMNTLLQQLGVKIDNRLRNFLFKSTRLRQIEGIGRLLNESA
ncbi:hypothetical protein HYU40_01235 [Candidatus Woesearchaeota archaeon]|nr:hypothetical protein [Candidatus Woesearchaeota archaeon]